ncbi:hypothetical protein Hanom_Chr05g00410121 [Helianthus anomalus]
MMMSLLISTTWRLERKSFTYVAKGTSTRSYSEENIHQKTRGEYYGHIRCWDFDERHRLIVIKRTDGVQYFKPRARYLKTLIARDLHHLAQLDLNHTTTNVNMNGLKNNPVAETRNSRWNVFTPSVGRHVKSRDKGTGKRIYRMVYKPARCVRKIPMR